MKAWHRLLFVTIAGLLLVSIVSCSGGAGGLGPIGHVIPYSDENITVGPLAYRNGTINMSKGAVFEGYLTVRGGDDDIRFYIKDSYGNRVLSIGVRGRYDFSYRATSEGFHTFYLENGSDWFRNREVYIHYRVR